MNHKGTLTLQTKRLLLRKAAISDSAHMFYNWANDPRVTKYLTWEAYNNPDDIMKYIEYLINNYEKPDFYNWNIVLKEINEPIGNISVVNLKEDINEMEIGYCLGFNWWGQGIMTEAFREVIKFLFNETGVNRIAARHDVNNPNSGKVMIKCGLSFEGISRQGGKNNQGIFCDMANYAVLKTDYEKLTAQNFSNE